MGRKKYEEGGEVDPLEAANASEESQAIANEAKGDTILKRMRDEAAAPSFKEAFAAAREAKKGSFDWGGKKYTTAMAGEKKAAKASAPTASELDSYASSRKTGVDAIPTSGYRKVEGGEKIDSSELGRNVKNTLSALTPIGGGVGKIGAELATAGRGAKAAGKAAEVSAKGREEVTNPLMWAAGPKNASKFKEAAAKAEKSVPSKGREEVTNPMMWAAGPKNASKFKEAAKKTPKKSKKALDESDTSGGAIGYKKGGNVRGWGIARSARKAKIV